MLVGTDGPIFLGTDGPIFLGTDGPIFLGTDGPIFLGTDSARTALAQKRPIHQKGQMAKKRTSLFFQNDRSIAKLKQAFRKYMNI